ncbi:MAG: shikimate kinase [Psychrilyobacter sp.]|uniref:shikimate kinase n=1 Tax=Psychrilyobacter sp. TaxID=2586924 RepID=UPI003C770583
MKQNLILIGFMGSGKSTVGRELAKVLEMNFVDTDHYIEQKENMEVKDIFALKGEKYFRAIEAKYVKEISKMNNTVISTGGGVVASDTNITLLKENGFVIYLDCTIECIYNRVSRRNTRPLLNNVEDLYSRIVELLDERIGNYKKYMDNEIYIDSKTNIWDTVDKIKKMYIKFD